MVWLVCMFVCMQSKGGSGEGDSGEGDSGEGDSLPSFPIGLTYKVPFTRLQIPQQNLMTFCVS